MAAHTPEALHADIEDAFNRGDLEAYMDAYDDDATLVVPPDGRAVHGIAAIRAASAPLLARKSHMTIRVLGKVETDGLALTHSRWELTAPDAELSGRGTLVSRRRPDGTWRIVLDNPMTPD